ncbi:TPA: hypothetical protein HA361_01515 [Candidatus Woesearchaeota archaeon]|nr:hypothetical protein [Candidatus Woesearchaeota archaeon]HII68967.1 hypothetical protein [Candidatus Woesearchaeota archaeon]
MAKKTLNLSIKGMHCPSCEALIKDIAGDCKADVKSISHKTGKAEVSIEEKDLPAFKKEMAKEGYTVEQV